MTIVLKTARFANWLIVRSVLLILKTWHYAISPWLGARCRFEPTCSMYMSEAIKQYGLIKGIFLGLKRLLRCHPFSTGGHDPLPLSKNPLLGASVLKTDGDLAL